jgi:hypothetical protein
MKTSRMKHRLQQLNNDYDYMICKACHCHLPIFMNGFIEEIRVLKNKIDKYSEILGM